MNRIVKNASLLLGRDLTYVETGFIEIGENGIITRAGAGNYNSKTLSNKICTVVMVTVLYWIQKDFS